MNQIRLISCPQERQYIKHYILAQSSLALNFVKRLQSRMLSANLCLKSIYHNEDVSCKGLQVGLCVNSTG